MIESRRRPVTMSLHPFVTLAVEKLARMEGRSRSTVVESIMYAELQRRGLVNEEGQYVPPPGEEAGETRYSPRMQPPGAAD